MIAVEVQTVDGAERLLSVEGGGSLMEALQNDDLVKGTCGGAASCGTCHVYVDPAWLAATGERTEDEEYMLEALEDEVEVKASSRLSCQIALTPALDGIKLVIAPEV